MQVPFLTLVAASAGNSPSTGGVGRRQLARRARDRERVRGDVGVDAPALDSRWVVLVENGQAVSPPRPCLFEESLASLEAESAVQGAREGVTARVGTMRLLLSLSLGLRAEDFRMAEQAAADRELLPNGS